MGVTNSQPSKPKAHSPAIGCVVFLRMAHACIALLWELSNYRKVLSASWSFYCDFSRLELGHWDCSAAPRMGPCRKSSSQESSSGPNAEGGSGGRFLFGGVLPRGCGQLLASTVQPAIRVRLWLWRGSHYAFMRAWSRQASAPNLPASVCPRAKPGARRLPKRFILKTFFFS